MGLPPAKRRLALEQLGRERLNELTQRYALDVGDRRVLDNHVDALVRARSVDFAEVLGSLKREELQAMCEALGLERGGREKEALVQRILGGGVTWAELLESPHPRESLHREFLHRAGVIEARAGLATLDA